VKPDDFALIKANWHKKSDQIRHIADDLHIGLDSIVFVDDHAFEQMEVATALPGVTAVVMPSDPEAFSFSKILSMINLRFLN